MQNADSQTAQRQQYMMDQACLLLLAFHRLVAPIASHRCKDNPKIPGCTLQTITNIHRFVQHTGKYALELLYGR